MWDESMTLMATPRPRRVIACSDGIPGMSRASVVSSATAISGCTSNAVVCAPRSPTSSWVVATATTSADLFEVAVERDNVAELDFSAHPLDRQAKINEQLLHLDRLDLVSIEHMDRL